MGRMKGTLTSVSVVKPNVESLRTTIPVFVVRQLGLSGQDNIDWAIDKQDDVWIATIRKAPLEE